MSEFKVGDTVKCIMEDYIADIKIGDTGIVAEINPTGSGRHLVSFTNDNRQMIKSYCLKKINPPSFLQRLKNFFNL